MIGMRYKLTKFLTAAAIGGSLLLSTVAAQEPDNTKANKQQQPTADQAKNNVSDRETMQKIRQSIMDDKSLSTYGHNVKIIARNGQVTLKGPVRSEEEKSAIQAKAAEVAGASNVTNDLTVKPEKK
jgi:hyperosmotically inducible periplasmic protein